MYLDLTDNRVNDKTVKYLIKLTSSRKCCLKTISLEKTNITGTAAIKLFESIMFNKTISSLNIANNKLPDKVGHAIAELLFINTTLTKLDLHWNMFNYDGADKIFTAL